MYLTNRFSILVSFCLFIIASCQEQTSFPSNCEDQFDYDVETGNFLINSSSVQLVAASIWNEPLKLSVIHQKSSSKNKLNSKYSMEAALAEKPEKVLFSFQQEADDFEVMKGGIVFSKENAFNGDDEYYQYSLVDGSYIARWHSNNLMVSAPNTSEKRFVAFRLDKKHGLGELMLFSNTELISNVSIANVEGGIQFENNMPNIGFVSSDSTKRVVQNGQLLLLWEAENGFNEKEMSKLSVELNFYYATSSSIEEATLLIPIENDAFNKEKATYNRNWFRIE